MREELMTTTIESWFLDSVDFSMVPDSMAALRESFESRAISAAALKGAAKWEPILRGVSTAIRPGWTILGDLAETRRGIATGSNGFFLVSPSHAASNNIRESMLLPCVGRAKDVRGLAFLKRDYDALYKADAKCLLINFSGTLSSAEQAYVATGEAKGLPKRFLLASRRPWYSMEQRAPAPIWAAVFGRGDLGFVYNEASSRSLTNFHCVYPKQAGEPLARALTACLNSRLVREGAREHIRGYGGGLMKFEPKDLKFIPVPNLPNCAPSTVLSLASLLAELDDATRNKLKSAAIEERLDVAVSAAGEEAALIRNTLF